MNPLDDRQRIAAAHCSKSCAGHGRNALVSALSAAITVAVLGLAVASSPILHAQTTDPAIAEQTVDASRRQSPEESLPHRAAGVLARHCIECHDPISQSGDLDLTRRAAAIAGGESGTSLVAGDPLRSPIWQQIESESMPPSGYKRLTDDEKQSVLDWIEDGAQWPVEVIDQADFADRLAAPPTWLRRLTVPQYVATVAATTGVDISQQAIALLPADQRADGFTNTAYNLGLDLAHIEAFAKLAENVASKTDMSLLLRRHASCQSMDDECVDSTIASLGKTFFRSPINEVEQTAFRKLFDSVVQDGGDFEIGCRVVLQAMLQSPRFLYLIEQPLVAQSPEPASGYELATRLSFGLWGAPPDEELIRAAQTGELDDVRRVRGQVQRMLRSPAAVQHSYTFAHDWLDLGRLENLRPDGHRFPTWDAVLAADMKAETLAFFQHVAWTQNRPLSDLLTAKVGFLTPRLAKHYGIAWDYQAEMAAARQSGNAGAVGLRALYALDRNSGDVVPDRSQSGLPIDLQITDPGAVRWNEDGLTIRASTSLISDSPVSELIGEIKRSGELTVEAWVNPKSRGQKGPARIVTISSGASNRNVTIGQEGDQYQIRCRSTRTDANGLPDTKAAHGSVELRWTHLVFTVDRSGAATFYVNGEAQATSDLGGDFSNWDDGFRLIIGNETTGDRPWLGSIRRVAIYSRALSQDEVSHSGGAMVRHDLSSSDSRGGLLTQASVLSIGGDEASMVARGLFVMQDLLYGRVGNPPPCVDAVPLPSKPGMSQRDVAMVRLSDNSCRGCHAKFEPFAFGLERFDGMGAYHETDEHGNQLREDGEITLPGSSEPIQYKSSAELMNVLAQSDRLQKGITRKLVQFVIARPLVPADHADVDQIHQRAWQNGGTYASILTEILASDLVRMKRPETTP